MSPVRARTVTQSIDALVVLAHLDRLDRIAAILDAWEAAERIRFRPVMRRRQDREGTWYECWVHSTAEGTTIGTRYPTLQALTERYDESLRHGRDDFAKKLCEMNENDLEHQAAFWLTGK